MPSISMYNRNQIIVSFGSNNEAAVTTAAAATATTHQRTKTKPNTKNPNRHSHAEREREKKERKRQRERESEGESLNGWKEWKTFDFKCWVLLTTHNHQSNVFCKWMKHLSPCANSSIILSFDMLNVYQYKCSDEQKRQQIFNFGSVQL